MKYEAIQDESAELCFIFPNARSVLYFPLEIIIPEIVLHNIHYNIYQLKYQLRSCTMGNMGHGHGYEANIALGFVSCHISLSTATLVQYFL